VPSEKERKNVTFSENIVQVKVSVKTINYRCVSKTNKILHVKFS